MYINDVNIIYYVIAAIIGLFVGEGVNWANKRLPEYKPVFSKEFFPLNDGIESRYSTACSYV